MNMLIQSLNNHEMNTQIFSLFINERESESITSASKTAAQNYLCLVRQVRLTRLLRLARLYCDSLGNLAPLVVLLRLVASLRSTTSLGLAVSLGLATFLRSEYDLPLPSSADSFGSAASPRWALL